MQNTFRSRLGCVAGARMGKGIGEIEHEGSAQKGSSIVAPRANPLSPFSACHAGYFRSLSIMISFTEEELISVWNTGLHDDTFIFQGHPTSLHFSDGTSLNNDIHATRRTAVYIDITWPT